eukprot:NODE_927_length_1114_cov_96.605876_g884_i0.p1 GENE.NODE_927_length_1114_cov_96.605876_g884_i0~~NODE_927_length_1114_cov_96.605876_g884_i0.p1  ORF type:complete len:331 (-),score=50.45 NODE_927_length_1114_cov_96.605876_g884_i0:29-1021(-)
MTPLTLSLTGWIDLVSSIAQLIAVVTLQGIIAWIYLGVVPVDATTQNTAIVVYLFIFIFSQAYQLLLLVNGLWEQNIIQVFSHVAFSACLFAFSIVEYNQVMETYERVAQELPTVAPLDQVASAAAQTRPLLIATMVVLAVCTLVFAYLSHKLFLEFGWKIYKKIGADPKMRSMYRMYQIFIMLLKYDVYFFIAFAVQFMVLVLSLSDPEFGLTIGLLVLSLAALVLAIYAMRWENKILVTIWFIYLLLAIAYFIFKIVRIYQPDQQHKYVGSSKFLTTFAALGLVVILATFGVSVACVKNWGLGLKDHLISNAAKDKPQDSQTRSMTLV